jgi:hypothetical protein
VFSTLPLSICPGALTEVTLRRIWGPMHAVIEGSVNKVRCQAKSVGAGGGGPPPPPPPPTNARRLVWCTKPCLRNSSCRFWTERVQMTAYLSRGAPPHFQSTVSAELLRSKVPTEIDCRGGPITVPPRSPDLTPLHLLLEARTG